MCKKKSSKNTSKSILSFISQVKSLLDQMKTTKEMNDPNIANQNESFN